MRLCWEEAASRVGVICLTLEAAVPREELARGPGGGETSKEPRGQNLTASEDWPSTRTNLNDTVFDACGPHPGPSLGQSGATPRVCSFSRHRAYLKDAEPHASVWLPVSHSSSCI